VPIETVPSETVPSETAPSETETSAMSGQICGPEQMPVADLDIESRTDFKISDGQVMLIGSRSASSGTLVFPQRTFCPTTGARDMEQISFGPNGTLYSFSTIHISATRETPYTIGYVDFDNGIRVLAHVRSEGALHCDEPVVLQADGDTWCVTPVGEVA